jgi:protocatechuate 3,4-dioxygenase beta subunit
VNYRCVASIGGVILICGLSLSAQTPPRDNAAAQRTTGTARIRGRVVAADTGDPLRRAQISINSLEGRVNRSATTDGDGRFDFENLPAGRYFINVSKPGYVPLGFGQQRPLESGRPLPLAEGQTADRVDFALPRGSVITGRITDEHGEPVPGVHVQVMRDQYGPSGQRRLVSGSSGMFNTAATDDRGEFRVYGLSPGTYVLSAIPVVANSMRMGPVGMTAGALSAAAADPNDGHATTYYPGVSSPSEAQSITLGISQEIAVSFTLVATRLSRVSGTIRNTKGQPVNDAQVSLRLAEARMFSSSGIELSSNGTFLANSVAPGDYFIDVRPRVPYTQGKPTPLPAADAEFASVPITVTGADIAGLIITTGPGSIITGRVTFEGTSPRPPGQFRINAVPADDTYGVSSRMMDTSDNGALDENDRFQIRRLSGKVLFRAYAQRWTLKSVTIDGADITDVPYEPPAASSITGLEIVLTDRPPEISGTVTNRLGEPVKDYVVVVVPNNLSDRIVPSRFTASLSSDEDGRYQTKFLPPGSYFAAAVESHQPGAQWDPAFQDIVRSRGRAFSLSEGQTLTLDLQLLQ